MPTIGPATVPYDHQSADALTSATSAQTITGADIACSSIFTCGIARRVYCPAAGNIAIQRIADAGFTVYAVVAGQYLDGKIAQIGGSGSGTTLATVILEA